MFFHRGLPRMIINEKQKKVNTWLKSSGRKKKYRILFSVVFASGT